ncbi:MAG: class I SAM-dependent methyltransferase [Patescibacteria group bacterium]
MAFTDPQNNIDQFDLDRGMQVVDLGAGTGAYTLAAAKKVGQDGRVFAVEVQKELLNKISHLALSEHIFNVEVIWGDIEKRGGTKLGEASIDAAIISNTLFLAEDKVGLLKEAWRILKDKRRVLLVEWSGPHGGLGPIEGHVVYPQEARKLFEENGFVYERDIFAGDNHYGMVFRKVFRN